jgi:hypothetical protein
LLSLQLERAGASDFGVTEIGAESIAQLLSI